MIVDTTVKEHNTKDEMDEILPGKIQVHRCIMGLETL